MVCGVLSADRLDRFLYFPTNHISGQPSSSASQPPKSRRDSVALRSKEGGKREGAHLRIGWSQAKTAPVWSGSFGIHIPSTFFSFLAATFEDGRRGY